MTVRVIIDRKVKKGNEEEFLKLLKELRAKAIPAEGYIGGETLRSVDDPENYVVLTTWQSVEDWRKWEKSPRREKTHAEIEKLLQKPTKITIYTYV